MSYHIIALVSQQAEDRKEEPRRTHVYIGTYLGRFVCPRSFEVWGERYPRAVSRPFPVDPMLLCSEANITKSLDKLRTPVLSTVLIPFSRRLAAQNSRSSNKTSDL